MITFYFVRHGNKAAIPFDPPITEVGIKQAEATAEYLKNISFKAIIASPKLRTVQTAQIIAKPHSLEVVTDERLTERLEWENKETFEEFLKEWSKTDIDRQHKPEVGDSSVNKGLKMKAVVDELTQKYVDGNILIVTHGGSLGDFLRNTFGDNVVPHVIDPLTKAPHILISECSITIIEKDNDKYSLIKLNDISPLSIPLI